MKFTQNSGLVKVWVGLVMNPENDYTLADVPNLYNLREVVAEVVNAQTK